MSQVTAESIEAELKDIVDSAGSLVGGSDQDDEQANMILGRLFATIHKLNYLVQSQLTDRIVEAPATVAAQPTDPAGTSAPSSSLQPTESSAMMPSTGSDILSKFESWIQTIKQALAQLARILKASQYTIGVQFPFGVSVSITFTP